jgi:hypothetical protein
VGPPSATTRRLSALAVAAALAASCSGFRRGPLGADGGACGQGPGVCNVLDGEGCGASQVCVLSEHPDAGTTSVCALPGALPYGAACTSPDECVQGLHCLAGQCRRLCCGGNDDDCLAGPGVPANARCVLDLSGEGFAAMACALPCDWQLQDCAGAFTCLALDPSGLSDCVVAGTQAAGTHCQSTADCNRGLACVGASATTAYCRHICDPTAPTCSLATTCVAADNAPATFGFCLPP